MPSSSFDLVLPPFVFLWDFFDGAMQLVENCTGPENMQPIRANSMRGPRVSNQCMMPIKKIGQFKSRAAANKLARKIFSQSLGVQSEVTKLKLHCMNKTHGSLLM